MQGKESKKRALIVTTISGFVPQFVMNNVYILQEKGYEVHYASNFNNVHFGLDNNRLNGTGVVRHQVDFVRSPFKIMANIRAYRQLRKVMKETFYDMVHCHTPMGAVLARVTAKPYRKKGTKVFYTAHGFHFYKGAPLKYWMLFYPVEKWLARYTDLLVTINSEDYKRASRFHYKDRGKAVIIPGIGIDTNVTNNMSNNRQEMLDKLGISKDTIILTSVGELSKRKNHKVIFYVIQKLKRKFNITYLLCGAGTLETELKELAASLQIEENVRFLGFCNQIDEILRITDVFVFPSLQEGLSVAVMEAMRAGLPIVCSNIRGNNDLIEEGKGGHLVVPRDVDGFVKGMMEVVKKYEERKKLFEEEKKLTFKANLFTNSAIAKIEELGGTTEVI